MPIVVALTVLLQALLHPSPGAPPPEVVAAYAPRIWWHPKDPFNPMDPLVFVKHSSLWRGSRKVVNRGAIRPAALAGTASNERDLFLKYEDADLGTGEARDWPHENLERVTTVKPIVQGEVPIFWRMGRKNSALHFGPPQPGHERVLIEYWYHVPYSHATRFDIGNHQGDWEGLAVVVDLAQDTSGKIEHRMVGAYYAAHEGGSWHCASELTFVDGHPEAFSALGSHATYHKEGEFKGIITDHAATGRAWDTWHLLKPMVLEPYYGFAGNWGEARAFAFMSGPRLPSATKWLPQSAQSDEKPVRDLQTSCL